MKKKVFLILILFIGLFVTGCSANNKDALKFKEEYEKINGDKTSYSDNKYRTLKIDKNNPYVYSSAKEILEKINNKETFYVYFGSSYCPWCRSVIEKSIESAQKNNIKKIYYVDIWNGFHNEILRDTYKLNDKNEAEKEKDGTKEYYKLLEKFDNLLEDYTLTTDDGEEVKVGEKRIFAPDFIYVENGVAKKITSATSENQKDADAKLTKEILKDEEKYFNNFFKNK
ncbi:MAG: hypothetical protein PUG33_04265 [Mollicutes bacterium]|nr:hypothetical protein [Mollicutes bacterium]